MGGLGSLTRLEHWTSYEDIPSLGILRMGTVQTSVDLEGTARARDHAFIEPAAPEEAFAPGIRATFQFGSEGTVCHRSRPESETRCEVDS